MKLRHLATALGAAMSFSAMAAPIFSLTPPAGWDGTFSIKMVGYEAFTGPLAVGAENFGVLKVTSIVDGGGQNTLWVDGQNSAEITGVFSQIRVALVVPGALGDARVLSTGGVANFFINPFGSFNATGGFAQGLSGYAQAGGAPNTNVYDGISNVAAGGSLVNANWVTGVSDAFFPNPLATTITVDGTFIATSTPQSGFAAGFLSVTGGTYGAMFDTNSFIFNHSAPADLRANNTFCTPGVFCSASVADAGGLPAAGGWALRIDDPINGRVNVVPEPTSVALLGLGLLALASARRRKI